MDRILTPDQNVIRSILERITTKSIRYEIWFFEDKKGSTRIVEKALCSGNRLLPYWNIAGDYD